MEKTFFLRTLHDCVVFTKGPKFSYTHSMSCNRGNLAEILVQPLIRDLGEWKFNFQLFKRFWTLKHDEMQLSSPLAVLISCCSKASPFHTPKGCNLGFFHKMLKYKFFNRFFNYSLTKEKSFFYFGGCPYHCTEHKSNFHFFLLLMLVK